MSQPDIHDKIRAEVERRLAVARAASQDRGGPPLAGEHWRWECNNCDTPLEIDDVVVLDGLLECPNCESCGVSLRSVEKYPTRSIGDLSHFVVTAEEVRPVDGLHIALHDPADSIRRYEYALKVLSRHAFKDAQHLFCGTENCSGGDCSWCRIEYPCPDVADLATSLGIEVSS